MRSQLSLAAGALLFVITVVVNPAAQGGPPAPAAPLGQGGAQPAPPRGGGGGARATFPAQQRPPGDATLIARGAGLYGLNCRLCHGPDLRGGENGGPNLLRSQLVLNDQNGELIGPVIRDGRQGAVGNMPAFPLPAEDLRALAEYIHSVAATMRGQGNPPLGAPPELNVLVGDPVAGQAYFAANCASCHSPTGDLQGIGNRVPDVTTLQNHWISGGGGLGRGAGRGGPAAPVPPSKQVKATVTPRVGPRVEGELVRIDDFYIVLRLADGTERTFTRSGEAPAIDIRDPMAPHRLLLPKYTDRDIHNVTAYLVTLK